MKEIFILKTDITDTNHIVINKTFADIIGLKPIIGQVIEIWGMKLECNWSNRGF